MVLPVTIPINFHVIFMAENSIYSGLGRPSSTLCSFHIPLHYFTPHLFLLVKIMTNLLAFLFIHNAVFKVGRVAEQRNLTIFLITLNLTVVDGLSTSRLICKWSTRSLHEDIILASCYGYCTAAEFAFEFYWYYTLLKTVCINAQ